MKSHCQVGRDFLGDAHLPPEVADIVLHHHERMDGSGYPDHLTGDAISLAARIVAVADVLDAMVSHRPYHPALGLTAALAEIRDGCGSRYDPDVCAAALRVARAAESPPVSDPDGRTRDEHPELRDDNAALRSELVALRQQAAELEPPDRSRARRGGCRRVTLLDAREAKPVAPGAALPEAQGSDLDGEQRDELAVLRDDRALLRNEVALLRDQISDLRAENSVIRDEASAARDEAQAARDAAAATRGEAAAAGDAAAELRDREDERRDQDARHFEAMGARGTVADAFSRSEVARIHAADNRRQSRQDRRRGADDRFHADLDRMTSSGDRDASAEDRAQTGLDRDGSAADRNAAEGERLDAGMDRDGASADRGASAADREDASLDSLTGAYLRGPGLLELDREIARSRRTKAPVALAFIDVDGLKAVNEAGGHAGGDRLLRAVAHTLKKRLRGYDVIIRMGGDEFVCGLSGMDGAGALARLADVNAVMAADPERGSVTIGIAELAPDDTRDSLIGRADAALYRQREHRDHGGRQPASSPSPV